MADAPVEAPAEAPKAPESENNQPTNQAPAQAPDMHGFTSDELADIRKFFDANGSFEKVKARISNPKQFEPQPQTPTQPAAEAVQQPQAPAEPAYKVPEGSITAQEFLAKQYFQSLAKEEKYAAISKGIESGDYLKEMSAFGINALNQDGSINDQKVRMYLDLKAQTVPAKSTGAEPNASPAPTVEYYQVEGDKVTTTDQAYRIIQQDAQLKNAGLAGHPLNAQAEEFLRNLHKPADKK